MSGEETTAAAADRLATLYDQNFGGKARGRYRISAKHMRQLFGRKRLYPEDIQALQRAMYELGFLLVDVDSFYVVLSARTFANYRRINDSCLKTDIMP